MHDKLTRLYQLNYPDKKSVRKYRREDKGKFASFVTCRTDCVSLCGILSHTTTTSFNFITIAAILFGLKYYVT